MNLLVEQAMAADPRLRREREREEAKKRVEEEKAEREGEVGEGDGGKEGGRRYVQFCKKCAPVDVRAACNTSFISHHITIALPYDFPQRIQEEGDKGEPDYFVQFCNSILILIFILIT